MMRCVGAFTLGVLSVALATPSLADNWSVYIPPRPASNNPPPFSTSSWVFVENVSDDDALFGDPCGETSMSLHYQYWNSGDRDTSMRALHAVCVNQKDGTVVDSTKSP